MKHLLFSLIIILIFNSTFAQQKSGWASYYASKFVGRKCASGEIFSNDSLTCAHKNLPFGTLIQVCNKNQKCVVVKVNDRLPKKSKRVVDLSVKAAKMIDLTYAGQIKITYQIVGFDSIKIKRNYKAKKTKRNRKK